MSPANQTSSAPLNIHLISHNHWDREWIFTARYANRWLPPFFKNLFARLREQPDYRFVLDGQTLIIEDYLSLLPPDEAAAAERDIRHFVGRGQMLIGPAYLQPDWSLVSGEALVRNLLIGDRMARRYGQTMKAGWLLDNFGQIAQAPQIFRGFDIEGAFVWRGVEMPPESLRTEFWWEAPDGSRILGVYLLDSYRNAMVLGMTREIAEERILSHASTLQPFAATPNVLLMNGYEQVPAPDDVLPIITEMNQNGYGGKYILQSTPPEYLQAVRTHDPQLPVLKGYFYSGRYAPVLKGVYSSRSYLNQMNNDCQRELERWAEKFNTFAWAFGFDYPEQRFEHAWKTLLLNHTHDDLCGCCIDPIARDMEARFDEVNRLARTMSSESLRAIAQAVDTSHTDCTSAVIIFNPSSRPRREVVALTMEVPEEVGEFSLQDGNGRTIPHQLVSRIGNKADLHLWVDAVPSVGYKTYYVVPTAGETIAHPTVTAVANSQTMENDRLKVTINDDGTFDVLDKQRNQTYENLGYLEDGGDSGDTYDYSYPPEDTVITSRGQQATITLDAAGPLFARFRIEYSLELPESLTPDRQERSATTRRVPIISYIELGANSAHVEVRTVVNNVVKDHRLRVLFPSGINTDTSLAGMPFDVAQFPVQDAAYSEEAGKLKGLMLAGRYTAPVNTRPFQNFVGLQGDKSGLFVFSRGLSEYEVLPDNNTLALTMIRGVGWLARPDLQTRIGDVGPHILTPEAQGLGVQTFDYAIYPHGNDLGQANPQFESDRQTLKFRAVQTNAHDGRLPNEFSFFSWVSEEPRGALKLTALKEAESGDGLIIRFYNALDQEAKGKLRIGTDVLSAWKANLNEEEGEELPTADSTVDFSLGRKEIMTIKVKVHPQRLLADFNFYPAQVLRPLEPKTILADGDASLDAPLEVPPLITEKEVAREKARAESLEEELMAVRSKAYMLNERIQQQEEPSIEKLAELQEVRGREATLTRQHYEARISALLNQELLVMNQIEMELGKIGQELNLARVRKRVGEFLIHYYQRQLSSSLN